MKKIRILGIIAIVLMISNITIHFEEGWSDFKKGYEEGARKHNNDIPGELYRVSLWVEPTEAMTNDSIYNDVIKLNVPYYANEITTYVQPSKWFTLVTICMVVSGLAFVYGFCCFVRLLVEVSRKNVFCQRNVWRIRCIVYSYTALAACIDWWAWMLGNAAMAQAQIPGYEILGLGEETSAWLPIIMLIILTECFAVGVKMKEEQDLTI